ncbi:MAG TPA: RNA-binding protein, partial [Bacillales bacterium]|nr:RNA-binding protein [Bacillales bacterium]
MELYQHFRPDEKPFIDEVLGWRDAVKERYLPKRSD